MLLKNKQTNFCLSSNALIKNLIVRDSKPYTSWGTTSKLRLWVGGFFLLDLACLLCGHISLSRNLHYRDGLCSSYYYMTNFVNNRTLKVSSYCTRDYPKKCKKKKLKKVGGVLSLIKDVTWNEINWSSFKIHYILLIFYSFHHKLAKSFLQIPVCVRSRLSHL